MVIRAGQVVAERYHVEALLGEGADATVYRAEDRLLGRTIALKLLRPELRADPTFVARFAREAQTAARLDHPGIVPIFDYGESDDTYYLAMPYVPGGDLRARLAREGALPLAEAVQLAAEVAEALAAAHAQGLVHRDVKPANVLLDADGHARVTDFGIAKLLDVPALTATAALLGTPHYLAPEQAGGGAITPAADVYALGVVLFEMLAGRRPFEGENFIQVALQHLHAPPPALTEARPDAPPALAELVARALDKDPGARYADGATFGTALRALLQVLADSPTASQSQGEPTAPVLAGAGVGAMPIPAAERVGAWEHPAPADAAVTPERRVAAPVLAGRAPALPMVLAVALGLAAVGIVGTSVWRGDGGTDMARHTTVAAESAPAVVVAAGSVVASSESGPAAPIEATSSGATDAVATTDPATPTAKPTLAPTARVAAPTAERAPAATSTTEPRPEPTAPSAHPTSAPTAVPDRPTSAPTQVPVARSAEVAARTASAAPTEPPAEPTSDPAAVARASTAPTFPPVSAAVESPATLPPTAVPPTAVPPTTVPPTAVPPTAVPPTAAPPTAPPAPTTVPTAVPPTAVPPTAVPPTPPARSAATAPADTTQGGAATERSSRTSSRGRQPTAPSAPPAPVSPLMPSPPSQGTQQGLGGLTQPLVTPHTPNGR